MVRNGRKADSDEKYVLDLCDEILVLTAERQRKFPFLVGDPGKDGKCRRLPIDGYYGTKKIAVEYHEIQHSQPVKHFDKRPTISGVSRGEQRKMYDQRRRDILKAHGIILVEIFYTELPYDSRKRLKRSKIEDLQYIRDKLLSACP